MLNIAICDDEEIFGSHLKKMVADYLDQRGEVYSFRKFLSGKEFTKLGAKMAGFQIVFLDINMSEQDGIETAKKIRELSDETYIVFVTAFINYTLEGYKVNAFRYLLKNAENFSGALEECLDAIFQKERIGSEIKRYRFTEGEKQFFLKRLVYIESNLHTLEFHILEHDMVTYTLRKTLNAIEKDINDAVFARIHQSYLINLAYVDAMEDKTAILVDGTTLPIARLRYKEVMEAYIRFKGVI